MTLLSVNADAKTKKGVKYGYLTGILYLAPLNTAKCGNVCPWASKGCAKACLYSAGMGKMKSVQRGRIRKTKMFFEQRGQFLKELIDDIYALKRAAQRQGSTPVVRLNGTSDIDWRNIYINEQHMNLFEYFHEVQFYDYTKDYSRRSFNKNYKIVYSYHENSDGDVMLDLLNRGFNIVVVFDQIPKRYQDFKVVNGDKNDAVFIHKRDEIIGVKAKGAALKDETGFVIRTQKRG